MNLAELLRQCVREDTSISAVAREAGVPQATLHEFVYGRADGTFADIRLSSAVRLIDRYGLDKGFSIPVKRTRTSRMLLKAELLASGCGDSPAAFRERLLECLQSRFPGRTIDGLVCSPDDASEYCDAIRQETRCTGLCDGAILKALMNLRRSNKCPTGLKRRRTRTDLKKALATYGCGISADAFRALCCDCHADMYKSQTTDEITCHPTQAKDLCHYVRRESKCSALPDSLILSTRMNARKTLA